MPGRQKAAVSQRGNGGGLALDKLRPMGYNTVRQGALSAGGQSSDLLIGEETAPVLSKMGSGHFFVMFLYAAIKGKKQR